MVIARFRAPTSWEQAQPSLGNGFGQLEKMSQPGFLEHKGLYETAFSLCLVHTSNSKLIALHTHTYTHLINKLINRQNDYNLNNRCEYRMRRAGSVLLIDAGTDLPLVARAPLSQAAKGPRMRSFFLLAIIKFVINRRENQIVHTLYVKNVIDSNTWCRRYASI